MEKKNKGIGDQTPVKWRNPLSFTAVIPLDGLDPRGVRTALSNRQIEINSLLSEIEDLHFFRIVVLRPTSWVGISTRAIINSIHEKPASTHLNQLEEKLGKILMDIFQSPQAGLAELLTKHRLKENALYIGAVNKHVAEIRSEKNLQEALADYADKREAEGGWCCLGAEVARKQFKEYAEKELTSDDFPKGPPRPKSWTSSFLKLIDLVKIFIFFPIIGVLGKDMIIAVNKIQPLLLRNFTRIMMWIWWLWGGIFSGIALIVVRITEWMEEDISPPLISEDELKDIEDAEDKAPQNELTVCFPVRNSYLGRILLRIILFGSECGTRHFWTRGRLAGAQNIHFARLLQIDGGRSMIFMSDYAGAFDAYVDHFVGIGGNHRAVVAISSRLEGCPKTKWLYIQNHPPMFRKQWKQLIRSHQARASVWFGAYPGLTTNDIISNSDLRKGLFQDQMTDEKASQWLRLIK